MNKMSGWENEVKLNGNSDDYQAILNDTRHNISVWWKCAAIKNTVSLVWTFRLLQAYTVEQAHTVYLYMRLSYIVEMMVFITLMLLKRKFKGKIRFEEIKMQLLCQDCHYYTFPVEPFLRSLFCGQPSMNRYNLKIILHYPLWFLIFCHFICFKW